MFIRCAAVIALCVWAACGGDGSATDAAPSDARVNDALLVDSRLPECVPVQGKPDLDLELVATGLRKPIYGTTPPGDGRFFVLEQHEGKVRIITADNELLKQPFLDIAPEVGRAFEQGIIGLTFHPKYASNGRFFIAFTRGSDEAVIIEEWAVSKNDPNRADPGSRRLILEVEQTSDFHNGGRLEFGNDGMLYIALGDGGPQFDLFGHSQNLDSLRGKMLRIDVDGAAPYEIPPNNPFIGKGRGEIFVYGLRNPWTFTIDRKTGHMFIGDVGFASVEEIDVIPRHTHGQNFGWPILEGSERCVTPPDCDAKGTTSPIFEYSHAVGCSIAVGAVYRGCAMPGHHGQLFFSDYCGMFLRSFAYDEGNGRRGLVKDWNIAVSGRVPSIAAGPRGEIYLFVHNAGEVYKVVPAP